MVSPGTKGLSVPDLPCPLIEDKGKERIQMMIKALFIKTGKHLSGIILQNYRLKSQSYKITNLYMITNIFGINSMMIKGELVIPISRPGI